MKKVTINAEAFMKLMRLVPDLLICTKFASDSYYLGRSDTGVIGKTCEEKHKETLKLIDDTMEALKEIEAGIDVVGIKRDER